MKRRSRIAGLGLLLIISSGQMLSAQRISFSLPFNDPPQFTGFSILNNSGDKFFVLSSPLINDPQIMVYDKELQLLDQRPAPLLRNGSPLLLLNKNGGTHILVEYAYENMDIFRSLLLDDSGNISLHKDVITLPLESGNGWAFITSPGNGYSLLYQVNKPQNDSISISTVLLDNNWEIRKIATIDLAFSPEFDRLNPLYLDEEGNAWVTVYDQPLNFKFGSTIRLHRFGIADNDHLYREYMVREKKPVELLFDFNRPGKRVAISAVYVDFFSRDISGVLTTVLDANLELLQPFRSFEFDKTIKKDLLRFTAGITPAKLLNFLRLHSVGITDSGSFFMTTSLDYVSYRRSADTSIGRAAMQSASVTEQDPLRTAYQRDALLRQLSGSGSRRRGRASSPRDGTSGMSSRQITEDVMRSRQGIFNTQERSPLPVSFSTTEKKYYNKWMFLSFDSAFQLKWYQWYKKEYFSRRDMNNTVFDGTNRELVSIRYEHNNNEKLQLLVTLLDKMTGGLKTVPISTPPNIILLLSSPVLRLSEHELVFICVNTEENKNGLAKVTW